MLPEPIRRALVPALAALVVHATLLALYVNRHRHQIDVLLCAGTKQIGRPPYEAVAIGIAPDGYDGAFYYAIARAPWRRHHVGIDNPPARHLRIAYPLVCWLFSGGDARRLFWVMPAVNLVAIGLLAGLGSVFAWRAGASPWWGFVLPLALNCGIPAQRNLADCLSSVALLGLVGSWPCASAGALGAWALGAVLCREQNAALIGLLALAALVQRRPGRALALGTALGLWLVWAAGIATVYGGSPFLPRGGHFTAPFAALLGGWEKLSEYRQASRMWLILQASMVHWVALLAAALWVAARQQDRVLTLVTWSGVGLAALAGSSIYADIYSFRRVLVWHTLGLWLCCVRAGWRWPLGLLSAGGFWSIAAAVGYV